MKSSGRIVSLIALAGFATIAVSCTRTGAPEGGATTAASRGTATAGPRRIAYYRSPMNPSVRSAKPAKDEMGMDYVPVYEDELGGASPVVEGRAIVVIPPERRGLLGVRSEEVREEVIDQAIRTVGRVAVDERRLHHVHTKYDGYIERLYVDFTGRFVNAGEPLLSIYSPDLVATQQEYLLALRHRGRQAIEGVPAPGTEFLLDAARQRLLLWDVLPEDISRLEQTGEVRRTLDLHADVSGYVVQKMAVQGMKVSPGDTLFDIADLSRLWVLADIYEYNLSSVLLGTRGEVRLPTVSDRTWTGVVTYVAPTLEEKTRTIKVRLEVENVGGLLRPDMFADVFLRTDRGSGLLLPEGAVIDTGDRRLVFLDRGEGRFEPREVKLGIRTERGWQVLSGLAKGDRVVTAANFLLDSESSLKAALSTMAAKAGPEHAGH
jgi:Cu(I)/Ag(I) efflux system membrane fusion protein